MKKFTGKTRSLAPLSAASCSMFRALSKLVVLSVVTINWQSAILYCNLFFESNYSDQTNFIKKWGFSTAKPRINWIPEIECLTWLIRGTSTKDSELAVLVFEAAVDSMSEYDCE